MSFTEIRLEVAEEAIKTISDGDLWAREDGNVVYRISEVGLKTCTLDVVQEEGNWSHGTGPRYSTRLLSELARTCYPHSSKISVPSYIHCPECDRPMILEDDYLCTECREKCNEALAR